MIQSVQNFIWAFIILGLTIFMFIRGTICYKLYKENNYENRSMDVPAYFLWTFSFFGVLIFTALLSTGISYYLNPEWRAVEILLETFLGK